MGAQYSGLQSLKKNEYIRRLIDTESIDENDPFWNQLLSFANNLPFSKNSSKAFDEAIALECQKFHQNNLKSGNYGSLIRVFCRRSAEARQMVDNHLMALQTANALFIIRSFTKYIIEIENESALLEQLNAKSASASQANEPSELSRTEPAPSDSANASPQRLLKNLTLQSKVSRDDSQEQIDAGEGDSVNNFHLQKTDGDENEPLYMLITNILQLCIQVPVEQHTYYMHFEALNTLLVLLSVQMYTKIPTHESYIYETFMHKMYNSVADFVKVLLKNIIQQMPAPAQSASSQAALLLATNNQNASGQQQSSWFSSVGSGLWTVMTLGLASGGAAAPSQPVKPTDTSDKQLHTYLPNFSNDAYSNASSSSPYDSQIDCSTRLLAWQSCHILLVLTNHCTNESLYNPYRLALFHFTDTQDTPTNLPNSEPLPWFSIDYTKLFQMFTFTLHNDQYTLLLYMLLHRNQHFKMFILSRINIDLLIIPILKVVFSAPDRSSHHIYMALIVLLILSEDDIFNKSIHTVPIKRLSWYTERILSEISLGGLLVLVVIRTIQFNMTRMRDKYLHTNCLAALANMSAKFFNLHPYVCQRINSLFNLLVKKRAKIINLVNERTNDPNDPNTQQLPAATGTDLLQDLAIIEELMRMVLEIINSSLTNAIHHNSNLVYSILYHKAQYLQFKSHPTFQDVMQNIELVITHFSTEIDNLEDKSIENVKEIIDIGVRQFSRERFKKFPELKFKYVEEDQPEDFFVPYVWSLVYKCSNLYWIDHSSKLFDLNNGQENANS